jgi:putative tryptophan/tyrosine transport system substrate-binding protein
LQFLHELVPKAAVAALLANPDNPYTEPEARAVQDAAHSLGLGELQILRASSASEIDAVFQRLPQLHVDALIVSADFFLLNQHKQIVAAAAQQNLPAMYPWREYVSAGGMVSYGPSVSEALRLVGVYAGKILRGAPPAELPVEQQNKMDLVINLRATKPLQVSVPIPVLGRADEVIE